MSGVIASSTITFYQKSIFDFVNLFTNISGYLKFKKKRIVAESCESNIFLHKY